MRLNLICYNIGDGDFVGLFKFFMSSIKTPQKLGISSIGEILQYRISSINMAALIIEMYEKFIRSYGSGIQEKEENSPNSQTA